MIGEESQSSSVPGCCCCGCDVGSKRDTGANDAVPLHLRLAAPRVVTGVHLSDMCGVGTFALIGIVAELEIIIAALITAQRRIVALRCKLHWSAAPPTADHPGGQQLGIYPEPRRMLPNEPTEFGHLLLKTPEHHVGTIAHPGRRHFRRWPFFMRVFAILAGIAEDELARPDQILTRQAPIGFVYSVRTRHQTAYARLRDAVKKAKMLVPALRPRPRIAQFGIYDFDRAA